MKKCRICLQDKPFEEFRKVKRKVGFGYHSYCKPCDRKRIKESKGDQYKSLHTGFRVNSRRFPKV